MTPATVVGLAKLAGAELVAVTDHNSALNLPAAQVAADAYGIKLLPGIEVNTQEELHLLCYFPTLEKALLMGERIFESLPERPYDPLVWGRQIVMDENDRELRDVNRLLTGACALDVYEAKRLCESLGGIAVPAHTEKDSYSLLSVLGFCPEDLSFEAFEMVSPERYESFVSRGFLPPGREVLCSSDAHCMEAVGGALRRLSDDSVLKRLTAGL